MKKIYKKIINVFKTYFILPHILALVIILVLSIIFLLGAVVEKDTFISSIYANIFAGLLTGVVISLISTIRAMYLYRINSLIKWLKELHKNCLEFTKESMKMYSLKENNSLSENEKYDKIYGLLCLGNDISVSISQGKFNETLPFNTYNYCKENLEFDAVENSEKNSELREKIMNLSNYNLTPKEQRELFKNMDDSISSLNRNVLAKINQLEIKNKAINLS